MTERHRLAPALQNLPREAGTADQWRAAAEAIRRFADEVEKGIYGLVRVATINHVKFEHTPAGAKMEPIGTTKVMTTLPPECTSQQAFEKIRRVLEGRDEIDLRGKS